MLGNIIYGFLYIWFSTMRAIGWWRWRVEGWENLPPRQQGGMVIAMNHLNWIDIPVVGALLPFSYRLSWLAKSELFQNPLAAWFFRTMYVIPIQRGKRDLAALETATEALKQGAVLLIFPEGTRSRNGGLGNGRGGAIRMAMQAGVPIVPIAVTGTEHGLKGTLSRKPVMMRIGQPFLVAPTPDGKIPPDMMDQLTNDMMLRIAKMLPDSYQGAYRAALAQPSDER